MLIYFLLCLRYYSIYKKIIYQTVSFADSLLFSWIKKYLLAFLLMQVLWLLFFLFYPGWGNFKEKWWYYLSFSSLLYYIGITGYANNVKSLVRFQISNIQNRSVYLIENSLAETQLENTSVIELNEMIEPVEPVEPMINPQLEEWKIRILDAIEKDKFYQNPNLTLLDVARQLNTNQTVISKMVNQGFKMNFNDFVNDYRVKSVIALLQQGEYKTQTLLGISIDCGFNSKTTFNRCFKKQTGVSPKKFIENIEKSDKSTLHNGIINN